MGMTILDCSQDIPSSENILRMRIAALEMQADTQKAMIAELEAKVAFMQNEKAPITGWPWDSAYMDGVEAGKAECGLEWQPISTAPKDGTRVSLARIGGPVWNDCKWEKMTRVPDRWASFIGPIPFEPTHWMPLPTPPEAKE